MEGYELQRFPDDCKNNININFLMPRLTTKAANQAAQNKLDTITKQISTDYLKWQQYDEANPVNHSKKALFTPSIEIGESLLGYLMRISFRNYYDSLGHVIEGLDLIVVNNSDWPKRLKKIITGQFPIIRLATFLGLPTAEVFKMTYPIVDKPKSNNSGSVYLRNCIFPLDFVRPHLPKFCPDCFREAASSKEEKLIFKKIWEIASYTVCTRHNKLLEDTCQKCHKELSWARKDFTKCQCGFDLLETVSISISNQESLLSARTSKAFHPDEVINEELNLVLHNYYLKSSEQDEDETLNDIASEIYALEAKENGYGRRKTRILINESSNRTLHRHLINLYKIPNASNSYEITTTKIRPSQTFTLSKLIGIPHSSIGNFIAVFPPSDSHEYTPREITKLADLYRSLLPLKKVADKIGMSEYVVKKFVKAGHINPTLSPENDYGDYLFTHSEIDSFLDSIRQNVMIPSGSETLIAPFNAHSVATKISLEIVDLVEHIFDGTLPIYNYDEDIGLNSILVNRSDLLAINQIDKLDEHLISIQDAAAQLGIYTDAIYRTIKTGMLNVTKLTINKAVQSYIDQRALSIFKAEYIYINEIAKQFGVSPTNLAYKIIDAGITPVSGPGIDNNLLYIFKRAEIDNADLSTIVNNENYVAKTGRPKKGIPTKWDDHPLLIDATAIAEQLDTTVQKVSRLARDGYLNPYEHKGVLGNKRLFEVIQFRAYLKAFRENPDLVSLADALIEIDENEALFKSNWVRSKRIAFVEDGLEGLYLKRNQLDEIVKFKDYAMSTRDIVEHMKVDRSVVQNKHKLGYLKPISGPGIDAFGNFFYSLENIVEVFPDAIFN